MTTTLLELMRIMEHGADCRCRSCAEEWSFRTWNTVTPRGERVALPESRSTAFADEGAFTGQAFTIIMGSDCVTPRRPTSDGEYL